MKATVMKPVEIEIKYIEMNLPVRYDDEDMPESFPFRDGEWWSVTVDIDTGKIQDWPKGWAYDLYMKVVDGGTYRLLDANRDLVKEISDYVPHGVVPGEFGDYVDLKINSSGKIANWPKKPDVDAWFPIDDD